MARGRRKPDLSKANSPHICKCCDGPKSKRDQNCIVCQTWAQSVYKKHRRAIALHFYKEREFNAF